MEIQAQTIAPTPRREPRNKGKLIGQKPPLRPKQVWSIRTRLQMDGRTRDLAMFNLAIDSKLRGCDVVSLRVRGHRAARTPLLRTEHAWSILLMDAGAKLEVRKQWSD